ncbi:MAG: hypothetical protein R8L07_11500 [Alphaproteobacteria bacterium]|nr:hypothetical protein [Alphaproteobacteria bacterium]
MSVVIGTVGGLALTEVLLASVLYFSDGTWIWNRSTEAMPHQARVENPYRESTSVFHPFFGYVARPSTGLNSSHEVSPDGFFNPGQILPLENDPARYDIVIIGGSVAAGLGVIERSSGIISKRLESLPQLAGKKVNLINLAQGGYQFPTPLMIISYYSALGQNFDAILLVDGFNEAWNLSKPDRLIIPGWWERLARVFNADVDRAFTEKWRDILISKSKQSRIAVHSVTLAAIAASLPNLKDDNVQFYYTPPGALLDKLSPSTLAQSWKRQIIQIDKMKSNDTIFIHFLQPTHHLESNGISFENKYSETIKQNYPLLIENQNQLKRMGINTYSMIGVFGTDYHTQRQYYQDECCHPTLKGYDILLNFMAEKLAYEIQPPL